MNSKVKKKVNSPRTQLKSRSYSVQVENYLQACRICMRLPPKKRNETTEENGSLFINIFNEKIEDADVTFSHALAYISNKAIDVNDPYLPQTVCKRCQIKLSSIFLPLRDLKLNIEKTSLNWNAFKKERIKLAPLEAVVKITVGDKNQEHYEITEYEVHDSEVVPVTDEPEAMDAVSFLLKNMKQDPGDSEYLSDDDDEDVFGLELVPAEDEAMQDNEQIFEVSILPDSPPPTLSPKAAKKCKIKIEPGTQSKASALDPFSMESYNQTETSQQAGAPKSKKKLKKEDGPPAPPISYEERRHVCEVCDKRFLKKSNLIDHLRLHANMKIFKCEFCDKAFVQVGNYKQHLRTHTEEKPFVCEFCNKSYTQSSALKIHIRTHTGQRDYQCEECPKAFTNASDLRKHGIIHDPRRRLTCEFCQKTVSQKVHLKKHLETTHTDLAFDMQDVLDRANAIVLDISRQGVLNKRNTVYVSGC